MEKKHSRTLQSDADGKSSRARQGKECYQKRPFVSHGPERKSKNIFSLNTQKLEFFLRYDNAKQREAGFERIKARVPKQSVQPWMPERLNAKHLGRERGPERPKNLNEQRTGLKHKAWTECDDTRVKKTVIHEGNNSEQVC